MSTNVMVDAPQHAISNYLLRICQQYIKSLLLNHIELET